MSLDQHGASDRQQLPARLRLATPGHRVMWKTIRAVLVTLTVAGVGLLAWYTTPNRVRRGQQLATALDCGRHWLRHSSPMSRSEAHTEAGTFAPVSASRCDGIISKKTNPAGPHTTRTGALWHGGAGGQTPSGTARRCGDTRESGLHHERGGRRLGQLILDVWEPLAGVAAVAALNALLKRRVEFLEVLGGGRFIQRL